VRKILKGGNLTLGITEMEHKMRENLNGGTLNGD
jgi:hypothetical protein